MTTGDLLKQGFAALKAGRNAEARSLLIQVVQQDKRNEKAWLWLSAVVDTDAERRICLGNVLVINPNNGIARRGLESLVAKEGVRSLSAVSPPTPSAEPAPTPREQPSQPPAQTRASAPQSRRRLRTLGLALGIAAICLTTIVVGAGVFNSSIGAQDWEYKADTMLYDQVCATQALTPYRDNDVVRQDIIRNYGYSREAMAALWLFLPYVDYMPQSQVERILADYARCGEDAFNDYINKMGKQGWELVSSEHLQITEPGGQWMSDITIGYGYEVSWKRRKPWIKLW